MSGRKAWRATEKVDCFVFREVHYRGKPPKPHIISWLRAWGCLLQRVKWDGITHPCHAQQHLNLIVFFQGWNFYRFPCLDFEPTVGWYLSAGFTCHLTKSEMLNVQWYHIYCTPNSAPGTLSKDTQELSLSWNDLCLPEAAFTLQVWQLLSYLFPCNEGAAEANFGVYVNRTSHSLWKAWEREASPPLLSL